MVPDAAATGAGSPLNTRAGHSSASVAATQANASAHQAQVHFFAVNDGSGPDGTEQAAVFTGHTYRIGSMRVDEPDEFASHLACEDHADYVHGLGRGDPEAPFEFGFDAEASEHGVDLRTAAVDHHGVDPDVVEEHDVLGEGTAEFVVDHGVAAVFDDRGGSGEALDPRQGLNEGPRFVLGVGHGRGVARVCGHCHP